MSTATTVRVEPRGAAKELFESDYPEVLLSGAAGTGKTIAVLSYMHLLCMKYPKLRALIVRKTHASLTSSTLTSFREKVAAEALASGIVWFYGGSSQEPPAFKYGNGSTILVSGIDKASKILSTEFDLIFFDEAIESTEEDLDYLVTRLRNGVLKKPRLLMATNPGAPSHHLKRRADEGRCKLLYSKHEDNPGYHDGKDWTEVGRNYIDGLDRSLKGARHARMRWGKWVAAEGQIFEEFDPSVHVIPKFRVPDDWPLYITIDFGFVNPFVAQWWRVDHDGRLYLTREIYHSKTLVEDHARRILNQMEKYKREPKPVIIADHDAEDRATLVKHLGLPVGKAKKDVSRGLQATQRRFEVQADGKPRIFFFADSVMHVDESLKAAGKPTSTVEEIADYVWDNTGTKAPKEAPLKINDHGCDAMRYMVAKLDLVARVRRRPGDPC
jgi:phage terminase large subunit